MKQPAISIPLLVKNVIEMIQGSNNETDWFVWNLLSLLENVC